MPFQHEFKVANPSSYPRDDYVEVDMETLGVPASLNEKSLKLSRVRHEGTSGLRRSPFKSIRSWARTLPNGC